MLELRVAHSLDSLAQLLAEEIRARREALGPFAPVTVLVPNRTVRTYLQLELAKSLGIAANLELEYLNSFFAHLLPASANTRLLERDHLQALILARLADEGLITRSSLAQAREYLFAAGPHHEVVDHRRLQLAVRLARNFEEYALSRPELLEKWRAGGAVTNATEAWQKELWLSIFGREGALARVKARTGTEWLDLPTLVNRDLAAPEFVHVFGFSSFAPLYQKALVRIAERSRVQVYEFSPIRVEEPGPLAAFARPVQEHHQLWREMGVTPKGGAEEPKAPPVTVLECPSPAREVEVVASEIWKLLDEAAKRGEKLRFDEIAVLIAGREVDSYKSHVAATFQQAYQIPTSLGASARESRVTEAIDLLLDLPLSTFKRAELLKLCVHPNVLALMPDAEAETWLAWADELLVLGGADRKDLEGTYVERDLHTWDQGLRRLALGAFLSGERTRDPRTVKIGKEEYLPLDHAQDETPAAARLLLLVRSLIADARAARAHERTLREWAGLFHRLVTTYLAPTSDAEEALLDRAARRLRRMEDLDLEGAPVSYVIARELARAQLEAVGTGGARDLSEGVVVAPFLPNRPIPFKVTFVLGLGEGAFPAGTHADPLDLRAGSRRPGEVTPTERDRLSFLETLVATREKVFLSYVARDPRTGEPLAASSVIRELEQLMPPSPALPRSGGGSTVVRIAHPLRRYASAHFAAPLGTAAEPTAALPEAFREAQVRALRELMPAQARLSPETKVKVDELTGAMAPPEVTKPREEPLRVSVSSLLDFLVSPLQGWAKHRLRLREDDEVSDVLLREDEPFEPSKLDATVLLREVAFGALAKVKEEKLTGKLLLEHARELYKDHARRAELAGRLPTGVFLEATSVAHDRTLTAWTAYMASQLGAKEERTLEVHRFGLADERGESDVLHPVLKLDNVELYGRTSRIVPGNRAAVILVASPNPGERHFLRGFLDHAVLAAAGLVPAGGTFEVVVIPGSFKQSKDYRNADTRIVRGFRAFTQDEARAWLSAIVTDFVGGPHGYLLPFEPVLKWLRGKIGNKPLESEIRWASSAFDVKTSDAYGPIVHRERYTAPRHCETIARRRLGPYVERAT